MDGGVKEVTGEGEHTKKTKAENEREVFSDERHTHRAVRDSKSAHRHVHTRTGSLHIGEQTSKRQREKTAEEMQ